MLRPRRIPTRGRCCVAGSPGIPHNVTWLLSSPAVWVALLHARDDGVVAAGAHRGVDHDRDLADHLEPKARRLALGGHEVEDGDRLVMSMGDRFVRGHGRDAHDGVGRAKVRFFHQRCEVGFAALRDGLRVADQAWRQVEAQVLWQRDGLARGDFGLVHRECRRQLEWLRAGRCCGRAVFVDTAVTSYRWIPNGDGFFADVSGKVLVTMARSAAFDDLFVRWSRQSVLFDLDLDRH